MMTVAAPLLSVAAAEVNAPLGRFTVPVGVPVPVTVTVTESGCVGRPAPLACVTVTVGVWSTTAVVCAAARMICGIPTLFVAKLMKL
jgi:hypothetical protein